MPSLDIIFDWFRRLIGQGKPKKPTSSRTTSKPIVPKTNPPQKQEPPSKDHEYEEFRLALGYRESRNRYNIKNEYGFLGCYQFGLARLTDLGLAERKPGTSGYGNHSFRWKFPFSEKIFLASRNLQDLVFEAHVADYMRRITASYGMFLDKNINGVKITMSGAIACCHLLGEGGLRGFIRGVNGSDANGTTADEYLSTFAGYKLPDDLRFAHEIKFEDHLNASDSVSSDHNSKGSV